MKNIFKLGVIAFFSSTMVLQSAEFESNVALSSEYMWRGMTQTDGQPAVSGGFDISGESGAYFGVWGSNVEYGDDARAVVTEGHLQFRVPRISKQGGTQARNH